MSTDKIALVVLGMHRSGTSSVAGALSMLGAAAPRTLMAPGEDNPRGFWESEVLMGVNDRLLAAGGSDWRDWRRLSDAAMVDARRAEDARAALAAEFQGKDLIVLKDPRICRLFPFWRGVLEASGYGVRVISPVRDPREVAASLMARNAMSRDAALRLWLRHVLEAEAGSRGLRRRVLLWDDFLADWRSEMARIEVRTGVDLRLGQEERAAAVDAFLSADLRRQGPVEGQMPALIEETQALLTALAHEGEDAGVHRRLDGARLAFDRAGALFADAPR